MRFLRCSTTILAGVLLTCSPAVSQDNASAPSTTGYSIPDKPLGNKKYLEIRGKVRPPVGIQTPQPQQQAHSGTAKFRGTTVLKFGINEEGTVDWVRILRSSSMKALDDKAVAAVKSWTFQPATKGGVPVAVETDAEINFVLY